MASSAQRILYNIINKTPFYEKDDPKLKPFLENIYKKDSYIDRYGGSVIIASLILGTFGCIFGYNYFLSNLKMLKKDWSVVRCNPLYIPFAGLINAPPHTSKIAYTAENLNYCLNDILKDVVEVETEGIKAGGQLLTKSVGEMGKQMGSVRSLFGNLRKNLGGMFSQTTGKIFNVAVPLNNTFIKAKAGINKSQGLLTTTMYTGLGSILSLRSFLGMFIKMLVVFLIFLAAFVFSNLAVGLLNIVNPFAAFGIPFFLIFIFFLLILIVFLLFGLPLLNILNDIMANTSHVTKFGSQHAGN